MSTTSQAPLLDRELQFELEPISAGKFTLSGRFQADVGQRVVVAISKELLEKTPEGFVESTAGFHFFYLGGSGKEEAFSKEFEIEGHGEDPIPMFIRRWYSEGEIRISVDQVDFSNHLFILGSCVSRDTFEFPTKVKISGYRARTSFASFASPPLPGAQELDLSGNQSPFQRRMVLSDLVKDSLGLAAESAGNLVLVDFIDERIPLMRIGESIATMSPEFNATGLTFEGSPIDMHSEDYYRLFALGWLKFLDKVSTKKVIINKVFWAKRTDKGEVFPDVDRIKAENEKLNRLYRIVEALSPNVVWINYSERDLVADSAHRWGQTPFHLREEFFKHQIVELEHIIK